MTFDFSEAVTGLTTADFSLAGTSTFSPSDANGWRVSSVVGSGAGPYTVVVSGTDPGAGTVIPTLAASAVSDLAGNAGPASGDTRTGTTVTSDRVVPTVSGLTSATSTTNATTITYTLTTSEAVSGTINMLCSDRYTDMGEGATYQSTWLDVGRWTSGT